LRRKPKVRIFRKHSKENINVVKMSKMLRIATIFPFGSLRGFSRASYTEDINITNIMK